MNQKPTLTKTDFKEFLLCRKSVWLKKHRPKLYKAGEFSLFLEKLIKDGYLVEEYVQKLFPDGVYVSGSALEARAKTQELLREKKTIFQATFETQEGLFLKADILDYDENTKKWDLYEVKASTSIKEDLKHNHVKDVIFQHITLEKAGVAVGRSFLVLVNKEYRRHGDLDLEKLLVFEDLSERVAEERINVLAEIEDALSYLSNEEISFERCECFFRTHGQRCDSFAFFNPDVSEYSVHHIFRGKKLQMLLDEGVVEINDIPEDFKFTETQEKKVALQKTGKPMINEESVRETLAAFEFPLYFLDYETYGHPAPLLEEYKTYQQLVFQYSLHVLHESGKLEHFEFLADNMENATSSLVKTLKNDLGVTGTIFVWHESFEKLRNKELGMLHPEYKNFFEAVNERIFDLKTVFEQDYLHPDFRGSASIKKVLPVLLPELSYKALGIQDGTMALSEWKRMTGEEITEEEHAKIRKNLLEYCALDTLAMVRIYQFLEENI